MNGLGWGRGRFAFAAVLAVAFQAPAGAHAISMSTGELVIAGAHAHYELRMPLYEIAHTQTPERALLDHIRFSSGAKDAQRISQHCAADASRDLYLCSADYEFPAPVKRLDVDCTFFAVTVPNHVHMLRAEMPDEKTAKTDEAVLDISFSRATLRFRPPTPTEAAFAQACAGAARALGGMAQLLFLAALVVASRSRKELAIFVTAFLAAQLATVLIVTRIAWHPAPRFAEAAAALTVAYLAVEVLFLPKAGARWMVAGTLGAIHGLFFAGFIQETAYSAALVMTGATGVQLLLIGVLALVFSQIARLATVLRPAQVASAALLVFGVSWFLIRLRS